MTRNVKAYAGRNRAPLRVDGPPGRGTPGPPGCTAPLRRIIVDSRRRGRAGLEGCHQQCEVLVTGGAGFVGSHLADLLLEQGDEVFALDNLSTGSIENIEHLKGHPRFRYAIDSVSNEPLLAELVDRADVVVHLAAAVGVKKIVEEPVHTIENNVHGTEVVLRHANKKKKLVVVASTSEVYGKSLAVPFREDADLVLGPTHKHRWAYACSKAIDEFLALAYWKEKKLPVIIVRLFNTVGPRQTGRYGMVIPNFVRQALAGPADHRVRRRHAAPQLHLRRRRRRRAAPGSMRHPGAVGEVFNIGNGEEITIRALAERVEGADRQLVGDRHDPVRPGVRGRLRGHAAARARHREDSRAGRLRADASSSTRS